MPCPNLSCGGHNFHGRFEFIDRQSMEQIVRLLVALAGLYGSGETTGVDKTPPDEASEQVETAEAEKAAMDSLDKDLTGSFAPVADDTATTTEDEVDAEVDARASAAATDETETDAQAPTDETAPDDGTAEATPEADAEPDADESDDGADATRTPGYASARKHILLYSDIVAVWMTTISCSRPCRPRIQVQSGSLRLAAHRLATSRLPHALTDDSTRSCISTTTSCANAPMQPNTRCSASWWR